MHIDKQTGMITWISTDADTTLLDVMLQVSDGSRQQTQRFQIRLVEGNTLPIILSAPVEVAWIDSLYIYSCALLTPTATPWATTSPKASPTCASTRSPACSPGCQKRRFRRSQNNLERLRRPRDDSTTLPTPSAKAGQLAADRPAERPGIRTWRGACRAARTRSTGHRSRPQRPGSSLVICPPLR